jgi:hypothetical protein
MPTYYYFEILLTNSTTGSLPLHHSADSEAWVCGPAYYMHKCLNGKIQNQHRSCESY